ncbi:hypothetical protein Val02_35590 [Virgisporangium aliadipatigenens]|uniref:SUKH-3 immunity protein n=1 Tax=Virgisporangium aliadipatigenens TaxID=741659 RepID=A0A8J3YMY3_9ACTN|nr:SUKH-3 domain-containing protein [Virgisporangium aliadipatigenens]GIJ46673.1 hypothetical protein Val02_35590 [Virgisporangium aliadipatigenens]
MNDPKTRRVLEAAGWHSGRTVDLAAWTAELVADGFPPVHTAARRFLGEYGGLAVHDSGPGVTSARDPFSLDPTRCLGEADRFREWSASAARDIAPIGDLDGGRYWLGIDERAEIYLVETWLASFGRMPRALDHLVLGYMPTDLP